MVIKIIPEQDVYLTPAEYEGLCRGYQTLLTYHACPPSFEEYVRSVKRPVLLPRATDISVEQAAREVIEKNAPLFHALASAEKSSDAQEPPSSDLTSVDERSSLSPTSAPTMDDAIAAGDGTLHGAIDYWQDRALRAETAVAQKVLGKYRSVLDGVVDLAVEAYGRWEDALDPEVGEVLRALAGWLPGYDKRADDIHAALSAGGGT